MSGTVTTTPSPLAMASPAETLTILQQVDNVLVVLAAQIARIVIAGDLTEAQQAHILAALAIVDGLRAQFNAERDRQVAALPAMSQQES